MGTAPNYDAHILLIANRGEIALRIILTARKLGLRTIAIYTPSDALSPHVSSASLAVPLPLHTTDPTTCSATPVSEASAYLNIDAIIAICKAHAATLVHPGYGFLSENADFASRVLAAGMTFLGPSLSIIRAMGSKHEARLVALAAGLQVVPGSEGLVGHVDEAVRVARGSGWGWGMGMVVCRDEGELMSRFDDAKRRAKALFGDGGVFLERYYEAARHVEVQVFGNGRGDVVHMRQRECNVQRRHQKVIEESPSPFCEAHPGLRERMCDAAVRLCRGIQYGSAGTVEFLVDENTTDFFFLEMNTRIQVYRFLSQSCTPTLTILVFQVEHPVTEAIHPTLDIVHLMIAQGIHEASSNSTHGFAPDSSEMQQATYDALHEGAVRGGRAWAVEGRVYAENPWEGFVPAPGVLQFVDLGGGHEWLRIDSWIETGMVVTPHFDPLLAKIIVTGNSRDEAISRFILALDECRILGPPQNVRYLQAIADSKIFRAGKATTRFLDTFSARPNAFKVLSPGIESTIQDLPGRTLGLGIPRSGPMDDLAFAAANILVGNPSTTEGLEIAVIAGVGCSFRFYVPAVVAVTGKEVGVKVNGGACPMWSRVIVPQDGELRLEAGLGGEVAGGLRVYVCVRGGFPDVPVYLGSKSTSMGLGGYQGRALLSGDQIALGDCVPDNILYTLPKALIPLYPSHWVVYVLPGPHDDEEYLTAAGIRQFYSTHWRISPSSNRLGIRLESPTLADKIEWARTSGGEGGSHPSNILDNGYARGTVNLNGDTPVILTKEGPDMGGYVCLCTVATAEMRVSSKVWKLGQLAPGNTVQFRRITWNDALHRISVHYKWLQDVEGTCSSPQPLQESSAVNLLDAYAADMPQSPILHVGPATEGRDDLQVMFRQAGDSAILVEFGNMHLDIFVRARIHAFQAFVQEIQTSGGTLLCPCIRSIMCHYNPLRISQNDFLKFLIQAESSIPKEVHNLQFPGRRITFPIVLDDRWNKEALQRYMATTRDKAVYLPSNVEYLARNNGLSGAEEVLERLIASDWLVLGVGFYLACPFLIPIDPRSRLIGQKMNPSRTFTPRGAIGIAGPVAAIYPIDSPGGYQLFGRTLPTWQTWGKGKDFLPTKPWLLEAFDQVCLAPVTETEFLKIEPTIISMEKHSQFLQAIAEEVKDFRERELEGSCNEEIKQRILLQEWKDSKLASNTGHALAVEGKSNMIANVEYSASVTASLFATVWKVNCFPGYKIQTAGDVLMILEAMKTEIPVTAGDEVIGMTVLGYGKGVKEGASVRPGDVLVTFR
ncbi:AHS2-domain-containing protein [Crassisporium funariophilum]|nr:AHS2-domain-containing protein [Crassisporium funariophilum]